MSSRPLILLAICLVVVPARAEERPNIPATKTWELLIPGGKVPDKLPLTGSLPNNWKVAKLKSGYLTTKEQLAELWKAEGQADPVPDVDFSKQSVVVIQERAKEIEVSRKEKDGKPMLRFAIVGRKVVDQYCTLAMFPNAAIEELLKAHKKP